MISFIVRVNERVAFSVGNRYYMYLATIFTELLQVYRLFSDNISYIYTNNTESQNIVALKVMKTVRRDILKLISTFISKSEEHHIVIQEFLPSLSELIQDYNTNVPDARDPEVLFLFAEMIKTMGHELNPFIPDILSHLF
jgi:exportin-1